MATYFARIDTDGTLTITTADKIVSNGNTYHYLREAVGGNIDVVSTGTLDVWVNDEGLFDCDVNPTLTNFIEREVGTIYQEYYGPALIAKSNNQGQTIGLTEQDIIHITQEVLPSMQELA